VVKRGFVVAVGGAAIIIAGLSGCSSSEKKSESGGSTATGSATATVSSPGGGIAASTGTGTAKVTIDGKDHQVQGSVVCATVANTVSLTIGQAPTGVSATLTPGDPPTVTALALGNVDGVSLGYTPGVPGGSADATKDGNTYTIKGNATGMDMSNPTAGSVTKAFEVELTCP
jgi:lipoprotein LpqH